MYQHTFLIVDTEVTMDDKVADFGAVVVDRKGNIISQFSCLVRGIFDKPRKHTLFWNNQVADIWAKANLARRYASYKDMLKNGTRVFATIPAINNWLAKTAIAYRPALTAYNLNFDLGKCRNTDIDLSYFNKRFCLWQAAYTQWAHTKQYRQFVIGCHAFNTPTQFGNMTYKTNAETMARFVLGCPELENEPHTALEDVIDYELPILKELLKKRSTKWLLNAPQPYNWRDCQVRDWFKSK